MTKAQNALWNSYQRATATNLNDVYGRHSKAKDEAYNYCRRLQYEMGGHDGRICSANSFQFSYAFQYEDKDGDVCLCYITRDNIRKFVLG